MILTGKAKEDFENWIYKGFGLSIEEFNNRHSSDSNHIIIEWLDSVGIYVNPYSQTSCVGTAFNFNIGNDISNYDYYPTRLEAITEAIKQANKIYNDKKI